MQNTTLEIAILGLMLVLLVRPAYALAAYISVLFWYPSYLVVSIGTIDISASRIVVTVLLLRCLCDGRIRKKFTWSRLDTWVALSMFIYVVPYCITRPLSTAIENRGGFLIDTWFAYIVARLLVTDRASLVSVIKCVSIVLIPLALLGVVESLTGWQPFLPLGRFCPWYEQGISIRARWGLNRAIGPFNHPILFGCTFAMFLPLIYYLRHEKNKWHILAYVLSGTAFVGALSSMSSGPWVMAIVAIFCLALERHKHRVKPLFIFFIFSFVFVEIASNRTFYHVVASYANPLGGAGWHRAKLIDLAIEHFDKWWLAGYGGEDPGWGRYLGMSRTDVTNQFILNGVRYGILGIIALCAVLTTAFYSILRTYKNTAEPTLKSLCWSLGCVLASVIVTWMSVSFFGQILTLFYIILGIIGSSPNLMRRFGSAPKVAAFSPTGVSPHFQQIR